MQWGPGISRFDYDDKVHFEKPIPLGDLIYLDRERCILCSRCVRFEDDLAGDPVLGFDNRGRSWEIIAKGEPAFDSKFSGNTTDICPVGALTSADFRFKARVWELQPVPSVCTHCSVGCNLTLDMRHNELKRVMPRENDFVNEIWLCDKGRFGMRSTASSERLTTPLIRRNGQLSPATWDDALALVADKLAVGGASVGGIAGPSLPNEDLFSFARLFRETLGSPNLDYRPGAANDPVIDTWSPTFGVGLGTNLTTLGKGTAVIIVGADPEEEAPLYTIRVRGIQSRGGDLTVITPYPTKLGKSANRSLAAKPGTGPQVVLAMLKTILDEKLAKIDGYGNRLRGLDVLTKALANETVEGLAATAGVSADTVRAAARAFASADNGIILFGRLALSFGATLIDAIAALAVVAGKVGRANNGLIGLVDQNARAAIDLGVRPDSAKAGLSTREMLAAAKTGAIKALFVAGIDPAAENPGAAQALDALEFLVVQDQFLTETAKLADVVLPLAAVAEREGTVTNAERRVQRFRQAQHNPNDVRAVWQVAQQLATMVAEGALVGASANGKVPNGKPSSAATWNYVVSEDVSEAIAASVRGYANATLAQLSTKSGTWGRQSDEQVYYDGTSYENVEGIGIQLPTSIDDPKSPITLSARVPQAPTFADGTLVALAAPRAYDNGDWSRGSKLAPRMVPAHVILSVADAQTLGVAIGDHVTLRSTVGEVTLPAQIDSGLASGVVLVPLVRGAGLAGVATGAVTAVTVLKA
jgi:NADH-quinone oxidoreductase subunit G